MDSITFFQVVATSLLAQNVLKKTTQDNAVPDIFVQIGWSL